MILTNRGSRDQQRKWGEDEPVFILRSRDNPAPEVIQHWIRSAEMESVSPTKIDEAEQSPNDFIQWQNDNSTKVKTPDYRMNSRFEAMQERVSDALGMTPEEVQKEFKAVLKQMADTVAVKGHDYGDQDGLHNLNAAAELGIPPVQGVLLRMNDKMSRLKTFARVGRLLVADEGVEDTLVDLAVYAVLAVVMIRGKTVARADVPTFVQQIHDTRQDEDDQMIVRRVVNQNYSPERDNEV